MFACLIVSCRLSAQEAMQAYQSVTGFASRLYSGSEYIRTYQNISGHPFLQSDSMQKSAIAYDGVLYTEVLLNYDVVRDEVIVRGPQVFALRLTPEKIDSFAINGRRFFRFSENNRYRLAKGFYELLYNGKVLVLAKRIKQITTASRADELSQFTAVASYFVLNNGTLYKVTDKNELIKAFSDQKSAVQKKLQQAHLNFRKSPELALIQIAELYDQIQN